MSSHAKLDSVSGKVLVRMWHALLTLQPVGPKQYVGSVKGSGLPADSVTIRLVCDWGRNVEVQVKLDGATRFCWSGTVVGLISLTARTADGGPFSECTIDVTGVLERPVGSAFMYSQTSHLSSAVASRRTHLDIGSDRVWDEVDRMVALENFIDAAETALDGFSRTGFQIRHESLRRLLHSLTLRRPDWPPIWRLLFVAASD